jgi:hypothetical protein
LVYYNKYEKNNEFIHKLLEVNGSQLCMEYLNFYYFKHLEKIYLPGGPGYIKTKKHFESTVAKAKCNIN